MAEPEDQAHAAPTPALGTEAPIVDSHEPLDLKLKLMIGSNFSLELVRGRLAEGAPEVVALLASKYVRTSHNPSQVILSGLFYALIDF